MKTTNGTALHTCTVCNQTGNFGAKWLFRIDGQPQPKRVHKPCGEMLLKSAPEGVKAKLEPSRELREEWRARRMTEGFWSKAFADAKPIKAQTTPVVAPQSAPAPAEQAA